MKKIALFIHYVVKIFYLRVYLVRGNSMMPSFTEGDFLLVNFAAYTKQMPTRGDLVVIRDPQGMERRYLKRVIGLPGEEIRLFDGVLMIDGDYTPELYLRGLPSELGLTGYTCQLEANQYFVMGDNRTHSTDSRKFGPISSELILGNVRIRFWPFGRLRFLNKFNL